MAIRLESVSALELVSPPVSVSRLLSGLVLPPVSASALPLGSVLLPVVVPALVFLPEPSTALPLFLRLQPAVDFHFPVS